MEAFERNSFKLPSDPNNASAKTLLAHWDELPEAGVLALQRDPNFGQRLLDLRRAETWLENASRPATACPSPEELYDFGRGPGYVVLTAAHRRAIEEHLAECNDCETHIETLTSAPPLPLDLAPEEEQEQPQLRALDPVQVPPNDTFDVPPTPLRSRWMPLAAAAAVLMMTFVFVAGDREREWPAAPLLRSGESEQALLFPRGRVLAAAPTSGWPGFTADVRFELTEVADAELYRIVLKQHDGGAFSSGEVVAELEGTETVLQADVELAAGTYTWEAWAIVNGLVQELGARDFQVVAQPEIRKVVGGLGQLQAVRLLHESGWVTDARTIARGMKQSAERDRYLDTTPGR